MTTRHRTHRAKRNGKPVGSLILERDILGIGRIKKASRIPTSLPVREQEMMLEKLHGMIDWLLVHRPDVLKRFRANKSQTPLQLYHAWKNDDFSTLPEDAQAESFKEAFLKYLDVRTDLKISRRIQEENSDLPQSSWLARHPSRST